MYTSSTPLGHISVILIVQCFLFRYTSINVLLLSVSLTDLWQLNISVIRPLHILTHVVKF